VASSGATAVPGEELPVAVIPAAGVGSRLRPHTHTVPKALISVAGKPMLAHILDELDNLGVREVTIVVGQMGDRIRHFVSRSYGHFEVQYVEQLDRQGLGHAVHLTQGLMPGRRLLIVLGDTIFRADFGGVVASPESLLGVQEVDDPRRFGIVEVDPANRVTRLVEKPEQPTSNLALVGIYYIANGDLLYECLEEIIRKDLRTRGEYQLTDALQLMLDRGEKMGVFPIEGWYDCGQPETLLATNRALLDMQDSGGGQVTNGNGIILPPVAIDPSATVLGSIIGPHVSVAAGAVVRNSIVRNAIINESAIVEDVLLDASVIGDHAVVRGAFKKLSVGDSSEVELI
jgi:glucose-1-phosphate thymidylyltransferase